MAEFCELPRQVLETSRRFNDSYPATLNFRFWPDPVCRLNQTLPAGTAG
jgi:hypothetical protein